VGEQIGDAKFIQAERYTTAMSRSSQPSWCHLVMQRAIKWASSKGLLNSRTMGRAPLTPPLSGVIRGRWSSSLACS